MKLGIRGKLFLVSLLLIVVVGGGAGVYLESQLRGSLELRIEDELRRHASTVRDAVEVAPSAGSIDVADALADRFASSTDTRTTIIAADGVVLGDSRLSAAEVRGVENHAGRPEVQAALREGSGLSRRYSTTIGTQMLYVAVPFDRSDGRGVVRVAKPLDEVDQSIARLRLLLVVAGIGAAGFAVLMSGLASHWMSGAFRSLVKSAQTMAETGQPGRLVVRTQDEIGGLAGTLNRLTEELEGTVATFAIERDRFETVLESMSDAIVVVDSERRVTIVNGAARELLSLSTDVVGRSLIDVVRLPALIDLVTAAESGKPMDTELELPTTSGRHVLASATPQGHEGGAVVVMHDVTEVRRLETIRRDFVANVSHELRTPVSVIRANAETLLDMPKPRPAEAQAFLEAVLRNADRLGRLVADLLDISEIEAGKLRLELEPLSIHELARRIVDSTQVDAKNKGIELVLEIDEDVRAVADGKALEQVLVNLIDNAIKYTPEGGHVVVDTVHDGDRLRIEVRDDGPGIDPAHRPRLFERFYRVDPGRSRDMGGTGLGLAIVKHLVEAMGGEVGVNARSPRGSTFWVGLPSAPAA